MNVLLEGIEMVNTQALTSQLNQRDRLHRETMDVYDFDQTYKELANQNLAIRNSGSIALDLAYIATGRIDGMWAHNVRLWDVAAGLLNRRRHHGFTHCLGRTRDILCGSLRARHGAFHSRVLLSLCLSSLAWLHFILPLIRSARR